MMSAATTSTGRLALLETSVDGVATVMIDNLISLERRGESLDAMQQSAVQLELEAGKFKQTAKTLKKKWWWKNCKWGTAAIVTGAVVLTAAAILFAVMSNRRKEGGHVSDMVGGGGHG